MKVAATNMRKRSYFWGIIAEYLCAVLLLLKGYSILHLRYRNAYGEMDIIAHKGNTVVFAEVKARESESAALHSITPAKQQIIAKAARGYVATHAQYANHDLRFDVMVVTSPLHIYHLKDAWRT